MDSLQKHASQLFQSKVSIQQQNAILIAYIVEIILSHNLQTHPRNHCVVVVVVVVGGGGGGGMQDMCCQLAPVHRAGMVTNKDMCCRSCVSPQFQFAKLRAGALPSN